MATLTRLASTLTARYFPSSSLTDAFYLDGRLCGKRETRQADITIDKDERGFFFSLFTHPTIEGFEPGTIPPFEPQLRGLCNEVKNGHKEIDAMIEKFLSTAVEVAGTTKLIDNEVRDPYFSGVIVRDSEAFAVTIGGGLAFLYRDDTMFPLTDAGIPMEPIDAYGNRVGDFQYYCSSKTANALWSNFFTLTPDDCIILCNKAIYDALGQREILRILTDAEDQCDAAGLILTQASARMPNTPMQISISFVESVTKEEKRGLFGRKKKKDDYDSESHELLESTVEGGMVGGAYHPAFRELCEGILYYGIIREQLEREYPDGGDFIVYVPVGDISKAAGQKKRNILRFAEEGWHVTIKGDDSIGGNERRKCKIEPVHQQDSQAQSGSHRH